MFLHRSELKLLTVLFWWCVILQTSFVVQSLASIQLPIVVYLNPQIFKSWLLNKSFKLQFHAFKCDMLEQHRESQKETCCVCSVELCNTMTVTITASILKCSALQYRTLIMWCTNFHM